MKKLHTGFTIVELLIYSGILLIFLYIMTSMFATVLDTQLESQTTSPVVSDGRYIYSRLAYDIGRASGIVTPASLGDQSSTLVITIGGMSYTYAISAGDLVLTDATGSGALNSYGTKVSNMTFRRYGNINGKNSVRVAFTLTSTTVRSGNAEVEDFETTIGLR